MPTTTSDVTALHPLLCSQSVHCSSFKAKEVGTSKEEEKEGEGEEIPDASPSSFDPPALDRLGILCVLCTESNGLHKRQRARGGEGTLNECIAVQFSVEPESSRREGGKKEKKEIHHHARGGDAGGVGGFLLGLLRGCHRHLAPGGKPR